MDQQEIYKDFEKVFNEFLTKLNCRDDLLKNSVVDFVQLKKIDLELEEFKKIKKIDFSSRYTV